MFEIGVDIGGTNIKIGLVDEALEIVAHDSIPFPKTTAEDAAEQIAAAIRRMMAAKGAAQDDIGSVGILVPGSIDRAGERVIAAHNLDFYDVPLRALMQEKMPGVPVYHDNRVIRTFRKSLEYVAQGEHLVIFSEQPAGHGSSEMELNRGFLQVAPLICKRTGKALKFYPVHVDWAARRITVSKPVPYDPALPLKEQEDGIIQALSKSILGK